MWLFDSIYFSFILLSYFDIGSKSNLFMKTAWAGLIVEPLWVDLRASVDSIQIHDIRGQDYKIITDWNNKISDI